MSTPEGHRERLRRRFQENPDLLSDVERVELLLTYAIPRRDVALLARELLDHFGSLQGVVAASTEQLLEVDGVGESTTTFIRLLQNVLNEALESKPEMSFTQNKPSLSQLNFFGPESESGKRASGSQGEKKQKFAKERPMRVFANDEIANSLNFLPQAVKFQSLEDFKNYLSEKLPYNAAETRRRRASHIIERFFPENRLVTPLTFFLRHSSTEADLKPVVFYHILKAEPIAAKVAEELIWPALPIGRVEREQIREFVLQYLPEASVSSQVNMLRALYYTYDLLGVGSTHDTTLRFQLHQGTLESLLYILTSEFPEQGIYSFEKLFNSPAHRWLLWDREWLRNQLYNLQDYGILSKISEIDSMRQFTLTLDQPTALRLFFEHPDRGRLAVRETPEDPSQED